MGIWPPYSDGTDVNAADVSPSGRYVVTADDHGYVKLFNHPCVVQHAPCHQYGGHSSHVMNVRWASDESFAVSVGGKDGAVMQWRLVPADAPQASVHEVVAPWERQDAQGKVYGPPAVAGARQQMPEAHARAAAAADHPAMRASAAAAAAAAAQPPPVQYPRDLRQEDQAALIAKAKAMAAAARQQAAYQADMQRQGFVEAAPAAAAARPGAPASVPVGPAGAAVGGIDPRVLQAHQLRAAQIAAAQQQAAAMPDPRVMAQQQRAGSAGALAPPPVAPYVPRRK